MDDCSTGPRTPEGKARSSQNGLRYAFLSSHLLIPGEDSKALAKIRTGLRELYRPVGPAEGILGSASLISSGVLDAFTELKPSSGRTHASGFKTRMIVTLSTADSKVAAFENIDDGVPF